MSTGSHGTISSQLRSCTCKSYAPKVSCPKHGLWLAQQSGAGEHTLPSYSQATSLKQLLIYLQLASVHNKEVIIVLAEYAQEDEAVVTRIGDDASEIATTYPHCVLIIVLYMPPNMPADGDRLARETLFELLQLSKSTSPKTQKLYIKPRTLAIFAEMPLPAAAPTSFQGVAQQQQQQQLQAEQLRQMNANAQMTMQMMQMRGMADRNSALLATIHRGTDLMNAAMWRY